MGRYTSGGVGRDIVAGALAGAAAIWIADKLDWKIYRAGGPESIRKTEAARPGGMDPAHVLAKRAADKVGVDLGDPKDNPAGHTVHYGMAMGMGALYGLVRGMCPAVSTARGAAWGVAMFVLQDELANTVMGTAGNPLAYPLRDHARGAATHTLYGIMTDLVTRLLAPWRDVVVIEQGPPLSERIEHGRRYLERGTNYAYEQGRQYADQGRRYAGSLLEQARANMPDVDAAGLARSGRKQASRFADDVRSRMADVDVSGLARAGQRNASRFAGDVRSQMPDMGDVARSGRKHARRFVKEAQAHLPEVPTSGLQKAINWLFG